MTVIAANGMQPPICLNCGKPCCRPGHVAALNLNDGMPDKDFIVCRHCNAIWRLLGAVCFIPTEDEMRNLQAAFDQVKAPTVAATGHA